MLDGAQTVRGNPQAHRLAEQLTAVRERAVASAASSMDMEGMPASEVEVDAARELAAGRIDFAEYRRIVSV